MANFFDDTQSQTATAEKTDQHTNFFADTQGSAPPEKDALPGVGTTTSAGGAFARAAATSVVPAFTARAGAFAGARAGALAGAAIPGAGETGIPEIIGGIGGAIIGGILGNRAQKAALKAAAPETHDELEKFQQEDTQQHPIASIAGGLAGSLPAFKLQNPLAAAQGLAAIAKIARGTAVNEAEKKAAKTMAMQLGVGAGVGAVSPLLQGQKPTIGDVTQGIAQMILFGEGRGFKGGESNAKTVRSDQGQVRPTGNAPEGSENAGGQNLQQRPPETPQPVGEGEEGRKTGGVAAYRIEQEEDGKWAITAPDGSVVSAHDTLQDARVALETARKPAALKKTAPVPDQSKQQVKHVGDQKDKKGNVVMSLFNLTQDIKDESGQVVHSAGSTVGENTLKKYGIQVPEKIKPQPKLSPEAQGHLDSVSKELGANVDLVSEAESGNPFASRLRGRIATIDRNTGKVLVNPEEFKGWLKSVPEAQRRLAVKSVVAEELNHLATDDSAAKAYWGTLSNAEKKIIQNRYGNAPNMNDTLWGHEAVNFELQRLARMTPHQVLAAARGEKWKLKSLAVLETTIRGIRKALGTKASQEGLAILDQVQQNLNLGRIALSNRAKADAAAKALADRDADKLDSLADMHIHSGDAETGQAMKKTAARIRSEQTPGARPRKREESVFQDKFILPGSETQKPQGSTQAVPISGEAPVVPPEERTSAEAAGGLPRPTGAQLQERAASWIDSVAKNASKDLAEGKAASLPRFKDFVAHMNWEGEQGQAPWQHTELKPGQLHEMWSDTVAKFLDKASGEQLGDLVKAVWGRQVSEAVGAGRKGFFRGIISGKQKVADLPESGQFRLTEEVPGRTPAERYQDERRVASIARSRDKVIGALFNKLVKPIMDDINFKAETTSPEELRYGGGKTISAVHEFSPEDERNPDQLGKELVDESRRSAEDPFTASKRLTAILDRKSGTVDLVSTYRHPAQGTMLVDPNSPQRQHSPLDSILRRYRVIGSFLRDSPVQNFKQHFVDLSEFNDKFANEARKMYAAETSYDPESISAEEFQREIGGRMQGTEEGHLMGPFKHLVTESGASEAERTQRTPMTTPEAEAILDYVHEQQGTIDSPDDVKEAMMALKEDMNRQALSGLVKLARGLQEKNPDLSIPEILDRVAHTIYEIHTNAKSTEEFVKRTMVESSPKAGEAAPTEEAAPEERGKELIMPIDRRPPTDVRGAVPGTGRAMTQASTKLHPVEKLGAEESKFVGSQAERNEVLKLTGESEYLRNKPRTRAQARSGRMDQGEADTRVKNMRDASWFAEEREGQKGSEYKIAQMVEDDKSPSGFKAVVRASSPYSFEQAMEEAGIEDDINPSAINRRKINEERERLASGLKHLATRVMVDIGRNPTRENMATGLDVAYNLAKIDGRSVGQSIRFASTDEKNKNGKKDILSAAKAKLAAGAVKTRYHYDDDALDEADRLSKVPIAEGGTLEHATWAGRPRNLKNPKQKAEQDAATDQFNRLTQKLLVESGHLNHQDATYYHDSKTKDLLDLFMRQVQTGMAEAERLSKGDLWDRFVARKWKAGAEALMKELEFAKAHWDNPELIETAIRTRKELDWQFDLEKAEGRNISYDPEYLPGRYDGELFSPNQVLFGGIRILGKQFHKAGTFKNYYEAISMGPYVPATLDISAIAESRARQGMSMVNRGRWWDALQTTKDKETGLPLVAKPKSGEKGPPSKDYVDWFKSPDGEIVYALQGYQHILHELVDPSAIRHNIVGRAALNAGQLLKHTVLAGDLFHLGRVAYYAASISGRRARWRPGWAALDFREADLPRAVQSKMISQETADWLTEKLPYNNNGVLTTRNRMELSKEFQQQGLNVGQIQDAIYKDLVKNVPGFGRYSKFLFDKWTRGHMMDSALNEYERISRIAPGDNSRDTIRAISKDLNPYFGSIGRQGWVKSATYQDLAQLAFLAPQWLEGLIKKEMSPIRLLTQTNRIVKGKDTMLRGIGRGLLAMIVLTQVTNMIRRGTPTWNNPEKEHKWDAYLGNNTWLSPLSVFNELTGDFLRLLETKPTAWAAAQTIGSNKLGFYGRAAMVLATGKSSGGEYQTTTGGVLKNAAEQLVPTPITFGTLGKAGLHAVVPSLVGPVPPGRLTAQTMSTLGLKTHTGMSPETRVEHMAEAFNRQHGRPDSAIVGYTDHPSYSQIRYYLTIGDLASAKKVLNQIEQTKPTGEIIKAMRIWVRHPFTGSKRGESLFLASMSDEDRSQYQDAMNKRYELESKFRDLLNQ